MKKLNGRNLKALTLLAVVLPVSLLVSFRLTGILQEPVTISETITLEAVKWEIERPDVLWGPMNETVENSYMNDGCSILFNILIASYIDSAMEYKASACLYLVAEVEANVSEGFVDGLRISFNENYNQSQVNILEGQDYKYSIIAENLQTRNVVDYADGKGGTGGVGESLKGYLEAVGVNKPTHVYYRISVHWILQSQQTQSHEMEASLQLTYNNGTALKEAVLPVVLKLSEDAGDTFETAKEIGFGNYTGWHHVWTDPEDFFRVWMEEGKTVKIQLSPKPPLGIILDLYLYNTSRDLVASSCSKIRDHTEEITYTINQSGWWYIRVVNADSANGLYTLSIQ